MDRALALQIKRFTATGAGTATLVQPSDIPSGSSGVFAITSVQYDHTAGGSVVIRESTGPKVQVQIRNTASVLSLQYTFEPAIPIKVSPSNNIESVITTGGTVYVHGYWAQ